LEYRIDLHYQKCKDAKLQLLNQLTEVQSNLNEGILKPNFCDESGSYLLYRICCGAGFHSDKEDQYTLKSNIDTLIFDKGFKYYPEKIVDKNDG
jgi:hypothetical protein